MNIAEFRAFLPQFTNSTTWPDAVVQLALDEADYETGGARWTGTTKDRGQGFYAGHYLLVNYPNGGDGAASGSTKFSANSKSVGDESVSFNSGNINNMSVGDAWLASTQYGIQFMRLRSRAGKGAVAV
jgi:hypothetical protein